MGAARDFYEQVVLPYQGDDCLIWPFNRNNMGYGIISNPARPCGGLRVVSALVCEHTNGPKPTPKHETRHNCGNGGLGCVTSNHVVWGTHKENLEDKKKHGTMNWGEQQWRSKLTEQQVREIRSMNGTLQEIADKYGVVFQTISKIKRRKNWRHIGD